MSKIFFTSDTHFGSKRTLELSKRPFKNVKEMDKTMIKNWNKIVGKEDIVYHLGDFGNYDVSHKLNGEIILLKGNYEVKDGISKIHNYNFKLVDFDKGFTNYLLTQMKTGMIFLCHEPSNMNPNYFNLFGHIHKLQMVRRNGLNVGVDCHNYTPIELDDVCFYKKAIEDIYDSEVFGD